MSKQNLMQISSRVLNRPLLLEPAYARVFFGALSSRLGIAQLFDSGGQLGEPEKLRVGADYFDDSETRASKPYRVEGGVAILPIEGTLVHKFGYLNPSSGMTGYDGIIERLKFACMDPDVKGILADYDTPGGEVSGCFDAAYQMRKLAEESGKPLWSLCYDMTASAGMALASSGSRRLITQTGVAGSVGVLMAHSSFEKYLESAGIKVTLIHSGAHKVEGNPYEDLPPEVLARFKTETDQLRLEFATIVSNMLNMDVQQVMDTEAAMYRGQEAVDVGFADEVVNGNEAVSIFSEYLSTLDSKTFIPGGNMDPKKDDQGNPPEAGASAQENVTKQDLAASTASAKAEERTRFQGILNCDEAKGKGNLANHLAFKTDMSVEDAKALLSTSEESAESNDSPLNKAMRSTKQPNVSADADADSQDETSSNVDQLMGSYQKATGIKPHAQ